MDRKIIHFNIYKYKWIKISKMRWISKSVIDPSTIVILKYDRPRKEKYLYPVCNTCKCKMIDDVYGEVLCNSNTCCFIRSIHTEIPKICHNHKIKNIYKLLENFLTIPKDIVFIITQYMPLIDMDYSKFYINQCGNLINCWKPGYTCNCDTCILDRFFNQLK
jgi:hypothetical protein